MDEIMSELYHHGILGQKWGVRRYQNEDGSLTEAGKRRLERKDNKWAEKNYKKIYNKAYSKSEKELRKYVKKDLNRQYSSIGKSYINSYNQKMAELMSSNASKYTSPSGKVVKFVAKRGEVGVHLALADPDYDMSNVKNGVWKNGRIAYRKTQVEMS